MTVQSKHRTNITNFDAQARIVLAQYKSLKGSMSQKVHQLCEMYSIELEINGRQWKRQGLSHIKGAADAHTIYLASIGTMDTLFYFFHELAHVILQMRNINYTYTDDIKLELEADNFAQYILCQLRKEETSYIKYILCRTENTLRTNPIYAQTEKEKIDEAKLWRTRFA